MKQEAHRTIRVREKGGYDALHIPHNENQHKISKRKTNPVVNMFYEYRILTTILYQIYLTCKMVYKEAMV